MNSRNQSLDVLRIRIPLQSSSWADAGVRMREVICFHHSANRHPRVDLRCREPDLKAYRVRRGEVEGKGNRTINLELRILVNVLKEENLWKRSLKENYKPLPESESDVGQALTVEQLAKLERTARTNDRWFVAYQAEVLAANCGMRGGEIRKTMMGVMDLENRRIHIRRKATKTNKGARIIELNAQALAAAAKLYERSQQLGATSPDHYLLPADLSKHVKAGDPFKDRRGFDVTRHQQGWRTAWHNLRKKAGLEGVRFHDLRHTFITRLAATAHFPHINFLKTL